MKKNIVPADLGFNPHHQPSSSTLISSFVLLLTLSRKQRRGLKLYTQISERVNQMKMK
ncbi:hypothetical protein HanRHA438_Chr08g0368201 [Helianthus annuus]|uniref:Uncharacterized protein n=1 Tax=Helianthus annuus TaxID=4232 RepID=A0A9K3IH23_HELAN|nr:hypothetical protein HanXRQr2_Chr08g0356031 [Helianthus annuus]KAJ0548477.1 hypothetical protein HanIR_Chr08g0384271 [Helianthus annuus]KAJ0899404.1 hypothetical protein HanRHA438_Chr08g0368201 [Helianthus annuus]KAJ0902993.1 hypothetical protein HanPSC8_Chr08g0343851 [Helianthus annuus]